MSRPELKLAGLRVDPELYARSKMSYYTGGCVCCVCARPFALRVFLKGALRVDPELYARSKMSYYTGGARGRRGEWMGITAERQTNGNGSRRLRIQTLQAVKR